MGVGIGKLPVTPKTEYGDIGVLRMESGLAGVHQHNKNSNVETNK